MATTLKYDSSIIHIIKQEKCRKQQRRILEGDKKVRENMEHKMFCFQCQETANCSGCTVAGVCGKDAKCAALQDILVYATKGLSEVNTALRAENKKVEEEINSYIVINLFTTITNANFDNEIFYERIFETLRIKKAQLEKIDKKTELHEAALWTAETREEIDRCAEKASVLATENEDIRSLRELIIYGLKGLSAYLKHAWELGKTEENIDIFLQKALASTLDEKLTTEELIALVMETGKFGVDGMALLDDANTGAYGHPEITKVNIGVGKNPGILVSGHDLRDLEQLLEQTKGSGVDVYSHSEMLPAHYYPAFKKYSNFVGNYGNAWWKQKEEFESFRGPILMTTNCIVPPKASYKKKLFTTGAAGYTGCPHIGRNEKGEKDFTEIIEMAKKCEPPLAIEEGNIVGGFAHNQVIALADKVIEAVKTGAIKKFIVMAGCDGRHTSRNYYTDFAKALPKDTVILTAGCAKYKYNKLELGDIGGIPRVLDAGQCNDSYSLALIALKLKEAFGLEDINELPIAFNIAWYEQKAVIVLLSLLYLGVKNIHLGPTLPAFLSPAVAKVLVENFKISGIGTVEEDLKLFLE